MIELLWKHISICSPAWIVLGGTAHEICDLYLFVGGVICLDDFRGDLAAHGNFFALIDCPLTNLTCTTVSGCATGATDFLSGGDMLTSYLDVRLQRLAEFFGVFLGEVNDVGTVVHSEDDRLNLLFTEGAAGKVIEELSNFLACHVGGLFLRIDFDVGVQRYFSGWPICK